MQPIIGITTSLTDDEQLLQMNRSYTGAVSGAGGIPILLPITEDADAILRYVSLCDGLLLSGGDDVDPSAYGEAQSWHCGTVAPLRDGFELALCRHFLRLRKPILAICRGIQVLNVALNGTLFQDLQTDLPESLSHRQKQKPWHASHPVSLTEGSLLHSILGTDVIAVNSHHHQAIAKPGTDLLVCATAPDGVIEGVELASHPFCIGVQWHPERLWNQPLTAAQSRLFQAFIDACC